MDIQILKISNTLAKNYVKNKIIFNHLAPKNLYFQTF
jgi:hypothetical protein